jgi:hypothetical protein
VRTTRAVVIGLLTFAAGHALAIGTVVAGVWMLGTVFPQDVLLLAGS